MRRRILSAYWHQWRRTWCQRLAELIAGPRGGSAWRAGYGADADSLRAKVFEGAVRATELVGGGLIYSAGEVLLAGGRYRRLSAAEFRFCEDFFGAAELERAWLDEGAELIAGGLGIAYVSGFAVKAAGCLPPSVLVHELVHTRQFARWGWAYVAKCLAAQWWGGGYGYPGTLLASSEGLSRLNAEQEAARVEDFARLRIGSAPRHAR